MMAIERYTIRREDSYHTIDQSATTDNISPEKAAKYRRFVDIIRSIHLPNLKLVGVSESFKRGVSVYALFYYEINGISKKIKVRISDHIGRWSEYNIDLRDPKSEAELERALVGQGVAQSSTKI